MGEITLLLLRARSGDSQALGAVYELLYHELQGVARAQLNRHRQQTLNTVGLINESFLKLVDQKRIDLESRSHFLAISSRAMRQILIDYHRRRSAEKRGGDQKRVPLDEERAPAPEPDVELLVLDSALNRLSVHSQRLATVVECKFFGGMSYEEIGEYLGISARTVRLDWRKAKGWLAMEIEATP